MKLKKVTVINGALRSPGVKEILEEVKNDKKSFIRADIQDEVFDIEDSVADNSKMISLILTLTSRLYDILPTEQKELLSAEDKAIIEFTFDKFKNVKTTADAQLEAEGTEMITRILERQSKVTEIIAK